MDFHKYIDSKLAPSVKLRIDVERRIIDEVVKSLIGRDWVVRVYDGEDFVTDRTTDPDLIQRKIMRTDEDTLYLYKVGDQQQEPTAFIYCVYGNDGYDVLSNYSAHINDVIEPIVEKYC